MFYIYMEDMEGMEGFMSIVMGTFLNYVIRLGWVVVQKR